MRATPSVHTRSAIMAIKPEDIDNLPLEPFQPKHIAFPFRTTFHANTCGQSTRATPSVHTRAAINPEDIGNLPLEPFRPKHIAFPSRSFGKTAPVTIPTKYSCSLYIMHVSDIISKLKLATIQMAPDSILEHGN